MVNSKFSKLPRTICHKPYTGAGRAFTLVELILVLGIVWIVAASAATPFLSRFLSGREAGTASRQIVRTLRKAQNYALTGKQNSVWGVHYGSDRLTLFKGSSFAGRDPSFDEKLDVAPAVSVTGFNDVYFGKLRGKPSTTLSVTVSTSSQSFNVLLNSEGRVGVQ